MLPVVSVQTMRECDAWTIEHETPGSELMLRAARGIRDAVDWDRGSPAGIVIGSGNNGGDGAALAMLLAQTGRPCVLYRVSEKASPDNAFYLEKAKALGVPVQPFAGHEAEIAACPVLVDCLLGTGFAGTVRGAVRQAILCLNRAREAGAYVVSADINSGLNGDTGEAELAVHSDLTVSIGFFTVGEPFHDTGWFEGREQSQTARIGEFLQQDFACGIAEEIPGIGSSRPERLTETEFIRIHSC